MGGFLYFLAGKDRGVKREELVAAGLGYCFAAPDEAFTPRGCAKGPGGQPGVVLADGRFLEAELLGYFPESQTWRTVPGTEALCGFSPANPPKPADLIRTSGLLDGHPVRLGDGQGWQVPAAIAAQLSADGVGYARALPSRIRLDDAGRWTRGEILAAYLPLWDLASKWFDAHVALGVYAAEHGTAEGFQHPCFDDGWVFPAAVAALAINYRLGPAEVDLLGLFESRTALAILDAVIDEPGRKNLQEGMDRKKKAPDISSTGPGLAAFLPVTAQP